MSHDWPTSHGWSEAELEDLRQFFYVEGHHAALARFCGASLITHPDTPDPNQQALYAGCCELERRGLVQSRVLPDRRSVVFFGPSNWEWPDAPISEALSAALSIPADLLRNDDRLNRS